jgi:hypothetical protein
LIYKYTIPFILSFIIFSFAGFNPLDCADPGTIETCLVPEYGNLTDCSWNGIELKGKVQFVESFPDIKIQIVESFPDIKVKMVESFPNDCGEWQAVESFPDFTVQIVESFPDIKVQYVESFPGVD